MWLFSLENIVKDRVIDCNCSVRYGVVVVIIINVINMFSVVDLLNCDDIRLVIDVIFWLWLICINLCNIYY